MKKVLVSILFFMMLMWLRGAETVHAAVSDDSARILFNDGKTKNVKNGELVHVSVSLTKDQIKGDVPLIITWNGSNNIQARGISKTKDIIVKDENDREQKIGTYIVDADHVLVKFNGNIEKYDRIAGELTFDLLVHNFTKNEQAITMHVGDVEEKLNVKPADNALLAEIVGKLNSHQDNISWEIKVNPDEKEFIGSLSIMNELPEGLEIDKSSVGIEANDVFVKLGQKEVEFDKNKMLIKLNNKGPSHRTFTIKYKTKVNSEDALTKTNQVQLDYQLKDDSKRKSSLYKGRILDDFSATFVGIHSESNNEMARRKITEEIRKRGMSVLLSRLLGLLDDKKDPAEDRQNVDQEKTLTKNPELESTVEVAKKVNPKGLSGFNNKKQLDTEANDDTNESADNIKAVKENSEKHYGVKHRKDDLPQAGENTEILSLIGIFSFFLGLIGMKRKYLN